MANSHKLEPFNMNAWRRYILKKRAPRYISRGNDARGAGDWVRAATAYGLALEACPDLWPIWVQYGHMLKESGDKDGASQAYQRALELEPEAADTHLQVGHLRKLQNDLTGAAASYARALELDPNMSDAVRELQALGRADLVDLVTRGLSKAQSPARVDQTSGVNPALARGMEAKLEVVAAQLPKFFYYVSQIKTFSFQVAALNSANARHAEDVAALKASVEAIHHDLQADRARLAAVAQQIHDEALGLELSALRDALSETSRRLSELEDVVEPTRRRSRP